VSNTVTVTAITSEATPSILLAEDDPVTRLLVTRFLKNAGYKVDAVVNGSEALEKMAHHYFPMLITDWEMPGIDGVALCKAVRNMKFDGYVYALLMTSRNAKEHVIAGLEAGADDYLIKPVHELELIARLNAGRRILALEHSLRAANQRSLVLSITDALTGAYNRRYLMEQLPRELERCRRYGYPLTVLMCDIDHFKVINDDQGHAAGDDVLQQFAERAQKSIRSNSDWVVRYGGEEFLMVLPETPHTAGMIVAEKIRSLIAATGFKTPAGNTPVTVSFGVASTGTEGPDSSLTVDALIRVADECLYQSKQEGRNRTTGREIASAPILATG
jgi:two-component system, cell cycle response regulator